MNPPQLDLLRNEDLLAFGLLKALASGPRGTHKFPNNIGRIKWQVRTK